MVYCLIIMKRHLLPVILIAVVISGCGAPQRRLSGPEAVLGELRSITARGDIDRLISHIAPEIVSMYSPSFGRVPVNVERRLRERGDNDVKRFFLEILPGALRSGDCVITDTMPEGFSFSCPVSPPGRAFLVMEIRMRNGDWFIVLYGVMA
jgi:hypothetical protein